MSGTGLPVVVGVSSPSLSHTMALVDDSRIASSTPQSRGPYPAGSPSGGFDDGGYPPPRPRSTQDAPSARTPVMPDDDVNQSAMSPDVAPASVPASSEKSPSVEPASEASISVVDTVGEEWRQARLSLFSPRELSLSSLSPGARLWGWLGPLLVAIVAGVARFVRLGTPPSLVFDETYYVKGAFTLRMFGVERDWPKEIDESWNAGMRDMFLPDADYVVHPPLGKWMIAAGMFDSSNAFFWRLSAAVVGTIAVFVVARIVRRMVGSTGWGMVAGGLFAIDGVAIVHARTGLLDSFLMFFVVVALAFLVHDRWLRRERLARMVAGTDDRALAAWGGAGPWLGWSRWRWAAALTLGLACGVKWSGLYFVAVFCVMIVLWDAGARRSVGITRWWWGAIVRDGIPAALVMLPTVVVGYLLSWSAWFANTSSYNRLWHEANPSSLPDWVPGPVAAVWDVGRSFVHYHQSMLTFHTGLSSEHRYEAPAWGWLLQLRPTSFFWERFDESVSCGGDECVAAVTSVGNPLIWWLGAASFVVCLWWLVRRGDWRAGVVVAGFLAGWVPWLFFPERTIFTFYVIAFAPFVYIGVAYVAFRWWTWSTTERAHAWVRPVIVFIGVLVVALSVFFYPVWTAIPVPYDFWRLHMWFPTWI